MNDDLVYEISTIVLDILKEFQDIMSPDLPQTLPPHWAVNHQIELISIEKPLARASYWMSPLKLDKLQRQLTSFLHNGFVQPSKAFVGASVLFKRSKMVTYGYV